MLDDLLDDELFADELFIDGLRLYAGAFPDELLPDDDGWLDTVDGLLYVEDVLPVPAAGLLLADPAGDLLTVEAVPREAVEPVTLVAVVLFTAVLFAEIPLLTLLPVAVALDTALVFRPAVFLMLEPPRSEELLPANTLLDPV